MGGGGLPSDPSSADPVAGPMPSEVVHHVSGAGSATEQDAAAAMARAAASLLRRSLVRPRFACARYRWSRLTEIRALRPAQAEPFTLTLLNVGATSFGGAAAGGAAAAQPIASLFRRAAEAARAAPVSPQPRAAAADGGPLTVEAGQQVASEAQRMRRNGTVASWAAISKSRERMLREGGSGAGPSGDGGSMPAAPPPLSRSAAPPGAPGHGSDEWGDAELEWGDGRGDAWGAGGDDEEEEDGWGDGGAEALCGAAAEEWGGREQAASPLPRERADRGWGGEGPAERGEGACPAGPGPASSVCEKCGQSVPAEMVGEHRDWHLAMEIDAEERRLAVGGDRRSSGSGAPPGPPAGGKGGEAGRKRASPAGAGGTRPAGAAKKGKSGWGPMDAFLVRGPQGGGQPPAPPR